MVDLPTARPLRRVIVTLAVLAALFHAATGPAAASSVQVAIEVFPCAPTTSAPELRISDIAKTFATVPTAPRWSFDGFAWKATVSVPEGHYIVHSGSDQCSGESEQWVAIAGQPRHVAITLNKKGRLTSIDENMYAGAVFGLLPSVPVKIEIMSGDSIIGEQTRKAAAVDGNAYQVDHLEAGQYVLRIAFGGVVASREVTIPSRPYGATTRADLTRADASEIVKMQAAGSGFIPVQYNGTEPLQTFRVGSAVVDGWITDPLIKPSDYRFWEQRISAPALAALSAAQRFLASDSRIPIQFRNLADWSAKIQSQGDQAILVDLFPNDSVGWHKEAPKTQDLCIAGIGRGDVILRFDSKAFKVITAAICP
jgi:hypothetical protein